MWIQLTNTVNKNFSKNLVTYCSGTWRKFLNDQKLGNEKVSST